MNRFPDGKNLLVKGSRLYPLLCPYAYIPPLVNVYLVKKRKFEKNLKKKDGEIRANYPWEQLSIFFVPNKEEHKGIFAYMIRCVSRYMGSFIN